jgi:peptidoglycan/LPS O-acetylase OafA/YrhL
MGPVLTSNLLAVQMWVPYPPIYGKSIDGPGWTISTLAFFYLIFPWLLRRYQRRTDAALNRSILISMVIQAVVFFGLFVSISIAMHPYPEAFWVAHAWPISRLSVFEMGVLAGLLVLRQGNPTRDRAVKVMGVSSDQPRRWAITVDLWAGIFAFLIIAFSLIESAAKIDTGGWWWMQGVFPFTLLQIIVGLSLAERDGTSITARFLNWRPMLFLGRISLSLYLVHQPVIQYVAWIARPNQTWNGSLPTPMPAWGNAVAIPVSLILAVLLERYVETPARRYFISRRV